MIDIEEGAASHIIDMVWLVRLFLQEGRWYFNYSYRDSAFAAPIGTGRGSQHPMGVLCKSVKNFTSPARFHSLSKLHDVYLKYLKTTVRLSVGRESKSKQSVSTRNKQAFSMYCV